MDMVKNKLAVHFIRHIQAYYCCFSPLYSCLPQIWMRIFEKLNLQMKIQLRDYCALSMLDSGQLTMKRDFLKMCLMTSWGVSLKWMSISVTQSWASANFSGKSCKGEPIVVLFFCWNDFCNFPRSNFPFRIAYNRITFKKSIDEFCSF